MITVTLELSHAEARVLERMRTAGAFVTDADVLRAACWHYARHLDLGPGLEDDLFLTGGCQGELFAPESGLTS